MRAILRHSPGLMVSWFRRKQPDAPERVPEATPTDIPTAAPAVAEPQPAQAPASTEPAAAAAGKLGWMQRIGKLLNTDVAELIGRNPSLDDDLLDEIVDRYGEPPKGVLNLIDIALLRAKAQEVGITDIRQKDLPPDPWERGFSVRGY